MEFDKGRARPEISEENPDTVEAKLMKLAEMKLELKQHRTEYQKKTKHLRESIKSLENIVMDEVMKRKETITVGNIRAEYVPQVVIKMKKEPEYEQ